MKKHIQSISCFSVLQAETHIIIIMIIVCFSALIFSCCSCSFDSDTNTGIEERKTGNFIKVINWNLQTFFDAKTCGTEYSEFIGTHSYWDEEHYKSRLEKLCTFIVDEDADVYVFEEIENANILQDISNNLPALNCYKNPWKYACFGNSEGSALGIAVLSRYELLDMQLHQIDYRSAYMLDSLINVDVTTDFWDNFFANPPSMRPLLEVTVCVENPLDLFVCHWKSKAGDDNGETTIWRQLQERLLADSILAAQKTNLCQRYLICGDFNQKLEEFDTREESWHCLEGQNTKVVLHGTFENVSVYSPWNKDFSDGSYYFDGNWEKIDHFFTSQDLLLSSFEPLTDGELTCDEVPARYDICDGTGLSDHLPIMCWVSVK
ncbi:MAG: hypothetical protein BKP49_03590 [Treponema sp. CETP13]|nr:MAG: hypothetical protein BKP49_03590 [Treponema sp. CETP13]